jgi:hypothetical protein
MGSSRRSAARAAWGDARPATSRASAKGPQTGVIRGDLRSLTGPQPRMLPAGGLPLMVTGGEPCARARLHVLFVPPSFLKPAQGAAGWQRTCFARKAGCLPFLREGQPARPGLTAASDEIHASRSGKVGYCFVQQSGRLLTQVAALGRCPILASTGSDGSWHRPWQRHGNEMATPLTFADAD